VPFLLAVLSADRALVNGLPPCHDQQTIDSGTERAHIMSLLIRFLRGKCPRCNGTGGHSGHG